MRAREVSVAWPHRKRERAQLVCARLKMCATGAERPLVIRSPIGLVVGSCTSHPGVLGSIPKREEPGKTGAPCVKVPGSSRVPLCNRSCSNKHTHWWLHARPQSDLRRRSADGAFGPALGRKFGAERFWCVFITAGPVPDSK